MSKYHVEVVFEQFPWLATFFPQGMQVYQDARVGKFNYELLCREAGQQSGGLDDGCHVKIFFFDKNGVHLGNAHQNRFWAYLTNGKSTRSVREALQTLGPELGNLNYAVEVTGNLLTVYTPMKGFPPSYPLGIEMQHREEVRREIREELLTRAAAKV